jgi:predicted O-linked N-acetylglucosamine transferase (SPINDLY family)
MNEKINEIISLIKLGDLINAEKNAQNIYKENLDNFEITNLIGTINLIKKNFNKAIIYFEKAKNLNPNHHSIYNNLGLVYKELKNYKEAVSNFEYALKLNKKYAGAYNNLGLTFKDQFNFQKAFENFNLAISCNPKFVEAYNNLGILIMDKLNFNTSIDYFSKAIEINNKYVDALRNRALAYTFIKKSILAIKDYTNLKILDPQRNLEYETRIFDNKNQICDWSNYKSTLKSILNNLERKNQVLELINPWKILFWTDSLKLIKNYTSDYIRKNKKILKTKNSIFKKRDSNKKICIGYYSSDFRNHALARSVIKILENHNKQKFEIFAFHFSKYPKDELTFQISKLVDKFFDVSLDADETIIQNSRNNNIDIAIDLTGFTLDNRINIFLNRLAPIQVNFLGYAGTISNYHDYIITDKYLVPKKYKKYYFEKIISLPGFFQPIGNENKIDLNFSREKFNLPPNDFIYCCYNNIYKINYEIFNCWMRILKKTKNSILCLPAVNNDCTQNIYSEVLRNNIRKDRIIFLPYIERNLLSERYRQFDLFLDTFPYQAHTTAVEALTSGLPLISINGEGLQSRVSSSLLHNLRLPELITNNIEEYEKKAIFYRNNPEKLKQLKERLYFNMNNLNITNPKIYTKNIEMAYTKIFENYQKRQAPKDFYIN